VLEEPLNVAYLMTQLGLKHREEFAFKVIATLVEMAPYLGPKISQAGSISHNRCITQWSFISAALPLIPGLAASSQARRYFIPAINHGSI
jgi:hypothetical protein